VTQDYLSPRERTAHSVQKAVQQVGGIERVVDAIWPQFGDSSLPGQVASIMLAQRRDMDELGAIAPTERHCDHAYRLRSAIESGSTRLRELNRQNEASSRVRAQSCLLRSMSGDLDSLRVLASLSLQVSPAFDAVISSCIPTL
jgi:hypothetical protein